MIRNSSTKSNKRIIINKRRIIIFLKEGGGREKNASKEYHFLFSPTQNSFFVFIEAAHSGKTFT